MNTLRHLLFLVVTFLLITPCSGQDLTWYSFDSDFISVKYSNSAIGELAFKQAHPAKNVHTTSCGGNDAELHIGMLLNEVDLPSGQMPMSDSPGNDDEDWGVVAELPNTNSGNGKSQINKLLGKPVTFFGYFRVWDEGHGQGQVHPSNPHHVFEIHPAWGFKGSGVNFMRKDLVTSAWRNTEGMVRRSSNLSSRDCQPTSGLLLIRLVAYSKSDSLKLVISSSCQ